VDVAGEVEAEGDQLVEDGEVAGGGVLLGWGGGGRHGGIRILSCVGVKGETFIKLSKHSGLRDSELFIRPGCDLFL